MGWSYSNKILSVGPMREGGYLELLLEYSSEFKPQAVHSLVYAWNLVPSSGALGTYRL